MPEEKGAELYSGYMKNENAIDIYNFKSYNTIEIKSK